jgi:hypothetical protein
MSIIKVIDNKKILEEILCISSKLYEDQKIILDKLDNLEKRIINIEKKIETKPSDNGEECENLIELKQESLNIGKEDTLKALSYRDYRSIIYVFRHFYKNKLNSTYAYPIRITGKRSFEFYSNKKWNNDLYGHTSMNIVCGNIQNLFIKYNDLDTGDVSDEDFMNNQQFICKLSEEKYRKEIYKNIIEEVRINNI